jgi:hypothetical protein
VKNIYFILFLLFITTFAYSQNPCPGTPTVTYAGKIYNTVQIGSQCWLKENLNVGTRISGSTEQTNNSIIEKYCYNNDTANCTLYGGLYQWAEAVQYKNGANNTALTNPPLTGNVQGICPTGWHLPTNAEYATLSSSVIGDGNSFGFSALLSGYSYGGTFYQLGSNAYFWSSTEEDAADTYYMYMSSDGSSIGQGYQSKVDGFSVHCVKDDATGINDHSDNTIPKSIDLLQNFPNPFNPNTTISFTLPERTNVVMTIYNDLGEKVAVLFNGEKGAGMHSIRWDAGNFASGVYYYELKTEKFTSTKKLLLMK